MAKRRKPPSRAPGDVREPVPVPGPRTIPAGRFKATREALDPLASHPLPLDAAARRVKGP